jgi:cell surface protein SprA
VLDPFYYDPSAQGGDLYINLGNVSEDILKDSRKAFENGLPTSETTTNVDTTVWGRVSTEQMLKQAFTTTDAASRGLQDVGFDGLRDQDEKTFFGDYLKKVEQVVSPKVYQEVLADPSNDDFHYYKGADYDEQKLSIIDRYKKFNSVDGNTPVNQGDTENAGKTDPDIEDLNKDNTMNEIESYFQYRISLRPGEDMEIGKNHIVDKVVRRVTLEDQTVADVTWYQYKIPIKKYDEKIGNISDFKSIRFMRMFLTNFADSVLEPFH